MGRIVHFEVPLAYASVLMIKAAVWPLLAFDCRPSRSLNHHQREPVEVNDWMSNRSANEKGPISIDGTPELETGAADSWRRSDSAMLRPQLAPLRELPEPRSSRSYRIIGWIAGSLMVAAIIASAVLMLSDLGPRLAALFKMVVVLAPRAWARLDHAPLSAMPLLLAGSSYIALQAALRPAPMELLRRLMLGSAFVLWGIVQLMPPSTLATDLGDLVIALYVFDLGLMVQAELQR